MTEPGQPLTAALVKDRPQPGEVERAPPTTLMMGTQQVALMMACAHRRDSRLNAKTKGATEPAANADCRASTGSG